MAQVALQTLATRPGILSLPLDPSMLPPADAIVNHLHPSWAALRRTADGVELESHRTIPGPSLAASAPVSIALLLPAGQAARESARRVQAMNHLKQIGLALHNYHDTYRAFPAGYSANADGKPLLSWRVHILPFLEEDDLYRQFHLDEPWDSPHNKELIARMPELFRSPNSTAQPGMANYLGISGTDGVFVRPKPDDKLGTQLRQITDGTSNTLMTVEVPDASAVIWTRPGDFAPHKDEPKRGLLGLRHGGFNAGFADGSVRFIAESTDATVLKAFFTKSGGEAVQEPAAVPAARAQE
jgi:prepilin-type processing-associated H-X9-DG protein